MSFLDETEHSPSLKDLTDFLTGNTVLGANLSMTESSQMIPFIFIIDDTPYSYLCEVSLFW